MKLKILALLLVIVSVLLGACESTQDKAIDAAEKIAEDRTYYIPVHDVEGRNYNWRLEISDDPSLIVWCTYFPVTPGSKPITIPIIGKLTSGGKRPFPQNTVSGGIPDAQSMYGSSGEYRYGFGPSGKQEYYDLYQNSLCTTQPLTWQTELTVLIQAKDPILMAASQQAREALERGDFASAETILNDAILEVQGGR